MWAVLFATMFGFPAESWYGPVEVAFDIQIGGSPYDAQENDVRVEFISGSTREERLAFFDGKAWRAILLTRTPKVYKASLMLNGRKVKDLQGTLDATRLADARFIRIDAKSNRFYRADGIAFWPVGHNLGWQSGNFKPQLLEQLAVMSQNGLNWARIWSCHWDGKNPYWVEKKALANPRDMFPEVLDRWDSIVRTASKNDVPFQWVLFHHGMFSSRVNPNWPDHPWNKAKGGFLATPEEFFTDAEAIRRSKNWLRYAVARWGHEPAVMAWELFNEVEWVDAIAKLQAAKVGAWHEAMAAYLRSIDPYGHLVTSSSGMELPIWKAMDYYQPHGYPPSVRAMVMGAKPTKDKPLFYGEVGLGEAGPDESLVIRDGLWSGLMAGHAGAAQYWFWDRMNEARYREFAQFTKFLREHRLIEGEPFQPLQISVDSRQAGAVSFSPGQGWAKTTQFEFAMPRDAVSGALGKLSGFIQGPGKKDMMAEPIRFRFQASAPGRFEMRVSTVARRGAQIQVQLDGALKVDEKVEAKDQDTPLNRTFGFEFGLGEHVVTVGNAGPDWYVASALKIDGIGQAVSGAASVSGNRVLLWVNRGTEGETPESFDVSGLPLGWQSARATLLDLETGKSSLGTFKLVEGKITGARMASKSAIWLLTRT